jgi:hypothetical protein
VRFRRARMRLLPWVLVPALLWAQSPQGPARIRVFEATPEAARPGESVELRWSATDADELWLEPMNLRCPPVGRTTYVLRERTIFWLHASNASGGQSVPILVDILPGPGSSPAPIAARAPSTEALLPTPPQAKGSGIWIQFAALADPESVARLRKDLARLAGVESFVFQVEVSGKTLHRVRTGPFASVREAKLRLERLRLRLRALELRPIIATD